MPSGIFSRDVANLQGLLLSRGYGPNGLLDSLGWPDGKPGDGTARELREFQTSRELAADAICGEKTWAALLS